MEKMNKKCSLEAHKEEEAILFCYNCKIYMCNKCEKHHSELFPNHNRNYNIKNIKDLFTGLCEEDSHQYELKYFCKTHNKLCCAECITKFKGKGHGQHTDCDVCSIQEIENEKKYQLKNNIKNLEDISINLFKSVDELKIILEKIEKNKEETKIKIQKVFTKLRNAINEREDKLLLEVDEKFKELLFDENFIKENEKLPEKIKKSIEKGKAVEENWNKEKLNILINDCLNIENNINYINHIKSNLNNLNSNQIEICFNQDESKLKQIIEIINNFGTIYNKNLSDILNGNDFMKINEWIGGNNSFQLKYSAKIDKCNTDIFHQKCDNLNKCVFICKVEKGDIIGGYISSIIQKKNAFSDDKNAFIFNLSKNIIKKNKKKYSIMTNLRLLIF